MLALIIGSVVLLQVIGAMVMVAKMRRAPVGYEDADGFHPGREPFVPLEYKFRAPASHHVPSAGSESAPEETAERLPVWLAETHRLAS